MSESRKKRGISFQLVSCAYHKLEAYATPVCIVLAALVSSSTQAASTDAPSNIRSGMASFKSGDFKQAAESFAAAETAKPEDLRIAFDHGVALAAQGDDKAVELLQKAALSPDLDLAVKARYNLGCFAAAKAHKRFGDHPEKASLDDRKEGIAELATAVGHFRDCLRLDKGHADARQNLELIRIWIKSMQSLWEQNDRQKQRDELDLSAYLQMLEEKQRELRILAQLLGKENESPKRHEAQRQLELAERKLGEEIEPLKQKIEATLSKAAQSSQAAPSDDLKKAISQCQSDADKIGEFIGFCATDLHSGKIDDAIEQQKSVIGRFFELYRTISPFSTWVGRAVTTQDTLRAANEANAGMKAPKTEPAAVSEESGWEQDFVTRFSELLVPVGKFNLSEMEKEDASPAPPTASTNGKGDDAAKQREALKKAMEKAVELGPKIEKLSQEAADLLRDRKPADALPKQKESHKLLKEIADLLPKQDQKQDDKNQKDDKQQQDDSKQDKKNDNKEKKDDEKKQDQQKKDQQQKEEQKKNEAKSQQEAAKDQAEAAIRQVQERQQKRQDEEKEYQRLLVRPGAVDKDW